MIDGGLLIGYVTKERLKSAIGKLSHQHNCHADTRKEPLLAETQNDQSSSRCSFIHRSDGFHGVDLSNIVDESPMQMRPETPLELVTTCFQKMVR